MATNSSLAVGSPGLGSGRLGWRAIQLTPEFAMCLYFALGLLETLLAYFVFDRSDDHTYFLALANTGTAAIADTGVALYDLKAAAAAEVFYWATLPSRLLGGHELTHLLWLRALTLLGFFAAFEAARVGSSLDRVASCRAYELRRNWFLMFALLYPGQLAWTASLLRDGLACSLFFFALYAWSRRWSLITAPFLGASLALRPEFVLIPLGLAGSNLLVRNRWIARHPLTCLALLCVAGSVLGFEPRYASSQFSLTVFSEEGLAYPSIDNIFDVAGYAAVVVQALLDPLPLGGLLAPSSFGLAEAAFFALVILLALRAVPRMNAREKARAVACLVLLWFFAYFEVFVSSYSRHRLLLVVLLLAVIACSGCRQRYFVRRGLLTGVS